MSKATVIKAHVASYADPIQLFRGDRPTLTGRDDFWEGHRWLWAVAADGRAGWIPDTLLDAQGCSGADFNAVELTCKTGQQLQTGETTHGWTWCCSDKGQCGWVPDSCLEPAPS